jgi:TPR repeat protein
MRPIGLTLLLALMPAAAAIGAAGTDPAPQQTTQTDDPQLKSLLADAEKGDVTAQFLLGYMYAEGQGVAQNYQEAINWYAKAAAQGHVESQVTLGTMYSEGQVVPRDRQQAIKWYSMTAQQGNADVQILLAMVYADGEGGRDDHVEAYKWFLLAESNGKDINEHRIWLSRYMTPEQFAKASELATAYALQFPGAAKDPIKQTVLPLQEAKPERIPLFTEVDADPNQPVSQDEAVGKADVRLKFPSAAKRTVTQDTPRLKSVHYQALLADGRIQYNASFQNLKTRTFNSDEEKKAFLDEYLAGRAMVAWENKLRKKDINFQGQMAVMFKHATFDGQIETVHEGIVFMINNNFVCLSCVYPSTETPSPTLIEFANTFQVAIGE